MPFIERQNMTIRRGNFYLQHKTASHARESGHLDGSLALKFGKEVRTPAMQAEIVSQKLSFRDVFTCRALLFLCLLIW